MNLLKMLFISAFLHILFLWDEKFTFSPLSYKLIVTILEVLLSFVFFVQLSKATSLLNEAQQPYNYLIESIRSRDMQNQSLNEQIALMEEDIRLVFSS